MDQKALKLRKYQNAQIVALLYSVVFVGVIFYGYNNLLGSLGVFMCAVLSLILATFAWSIARFIGYDEGGIRGNLPAFGLLLVISAVGIFNSLMLNLEGKRIFSQRIENAQSLLNDLEVTALAEQKTQGIENKINEVKTVKAALMSEIQSPGNCGKGPEAQRLIMRLKKLLVHLDIPSGQIDCNNPASVKAYVDAYTQMIDVTMDNADWNNPALTAVIASTRDGRAKLACLDNGCVSTDETNYSTTANLGNYKALLQGVSVKGKSSIQDLMRVITPKLEELDGEYTRNVEILKKESRNAPVLKPNLDLEELRSIGQVSQIMNLIIARANRVTTYIYLLLAISFDALMVYFFKHVIATSPSGRRAKITAEAGW